MKWHNAESPNERRWKCTQKVLCPILWVALAAVIFMLIAGCASEPLTAEQQYERETRRIEKHEAIIDYIERCQRGGGIVMARKRSRRLCIHGLPPHTSLADYTCQRTGWRF